MGTAVVVILHRHMTDAVVLLGIGPLIDDQAKGEEMSRGIENVACRFGKRILCRVTCRPHRDTMQLPQRHWKCRPRIGAHCSLGSYLGRRTQLTAKQMIRTKHMQAREFNVSLFPVNRR